MIVLLSGVRIHQFFFSDLLTFLFVYFLLEKSSFSFLIHKIKFVFYLGMFSAASNGKLDYNGLNSLFH